MEQKVAQIFTNRKRRFEKVLNNFLFFVVAFACIYLVCVLSWSLILKQSKKEVSSIKFRHCHGSDSDFNRIEGFGFVISKRMNGTECWEVFRDGLTVASLSVNNYRLTVKMPDKYGAVVMRYVVENKDRLTDCDRIPKLVEAILLVRRSLTQN